MKAIFFAAGDTIDHTPAQAVAAGDVVVQGDLVAIAKSDIAANRMGALAIRGTFNAVKAAVTITAGQPVTQGALVGSFFRWNRLDL